VVGKPAPGHVNNPKYSISERAQVSKSFGFAHYEEWDRP